MHNLIFLFSQRQNVTALSLHTGPFT